MLIEAKRSEDDATEFKTGSMCLVLTPHAHGKFTCCVAYVAVVRTGKDLARKGQSLVCAAHVEGTSRSGIPTAGAVTWTGRPQRQNIAQLYAMSQLRVYPPLCVLAGVAL